MRNVKRDLALPAKKRWRAPDGARRCLHRAVKIDIPRCHGPGGAPAKVCANKVSRGKGAAVQVNAPAAFLQKCRRKRCTACGGVVGLAGFEPTHAGVKVPCLTAWRQPSLFIEKSELFRVRFPCNVGWLVGLEPTASRATIWRASQLRHSHHILVRPEGLEPPAHCLEGSCSIHLSYGRTLLSQWVPLWRQRCVGTGCERNNTIPIAFCQGKSEKSFNFFALRAKMAVPACRNGLTAATFRHSPAQSPVQSRTPRPAHDAPR